MNRRTQDWILPILRGEEGVVRTTKEVYVDGKVRRGVGNKVRRRKKQGREYSFWMIRRGNKLQVAEGRGANGNDYAYLTATALPK